jgi:stromal membrane-associated protein
LCGRFPKAEIERLNDKHHRELQRLRKLPSNRICAECREEGTSWASVNLGVFLCVRCSDVHRGVGTHISKVKGCTGTYLWGPDEIVRMQELGNAAAEATYGRSPVLDAGAGKDERLKLCRQKYEQRRWAPAWPAMGAPVAAAPMACPTTEAARKASATFGDAQEAQLKPHLEQLTSAPVAPQTVRRLPTPVRSGAVASKPPIATGVRKLPEDFDFDDFFANLESEAVETSTGATAAAATAGMDDPLEAFLERCLGDGVRAGQTAQASEKQTLTDSFWGDFAAW